jgi:TolA-binding protein
LLGTGDFEQAAEVYESYAAAYPEHEVAPARLSILYERQLGDAAKACTWYTKLATFRPNDANVVATRDFLCTAPKE